MDGIRLMEEFGPASALKLMPSAFPEISSHLSQIKHPCERKIEG
jgi:hypothetical protein